MNPPNSEQQISVTRLLSALNQLSLKALSSRSQNSLSFLIVNDTHRLVRYDQASLWETTSGSPVFKAISGEATPDPNSELVKETLQRIKELPNPQETSVVRWTEPSHKGEPEPLVRSALWLPIQHEDKQILGLWIERWHHPSWSPDETAVLTSIGQGFGLAWHRLTPIFKPTRVTKILLTYAALAAATVLFFVPIPLRVVAPCEIVAKDPILITAPLDGIIAELSVQPGQVVQKGDELFVYDKHMPLEELRVAEKQVEIAASQLNRATTIGLNDPKALTEAGIWRLQLDKEKIQLNLAKYRASQLDVKAPANGVVIVRDPDQWRGKPVQVGEKVMVLSDPLNTKVKILLSESDNIPIDRSKPIKVFLNINPSHTLYAKLSYVADYSVISEKGVPSFTAEADWVQKPAEARLGLKGSAILYGEQVTLFYFLMRKPWNKVREVLGY